MGDDAKAPDFARCVDIHRKPGFDPVELFFDPNLRAPKTHAAYRLLKKKLGFRMLMDLIPLDTTLVKSPTTASPRINSTGLSSPAIFPTFRQRSTEPMYSITCCRSAGSEEERQPPLTEPGLPSPGMNGHTYPSPELPLLTPPGLR